jgi:UDP-3-O-acyl-N-acetylglucosamine deacetylase
MWVFTTSGFISAVYKDGALQVRARDRRSLTPLAKQTGAEIVATPLADYPYRIAITNEQFSKWLSQEVMSVDYKNFKSEIAETRGYGFAKPLNKVWSVMHEVEDSKARARG